MDDYEKRLNDALKIEGETAPESTTNPQTPGMFKEKKKGVFNER